jgi:hypothetical protein
MRRYLESRQAVMVTKVLSGGGVVTVLAAVLSAGLKWHA